MQVQQYPSFSDQIILNCSLFLHILVLILLEVLGYYFFHFQLLNEFFRYSRGQDILKLPEKTLVYPAHDYNGKTHSTIENEKNNNPRLQVNSAEEYAEIMSNLKLSNPKMMDIAVPANISGKTLDQL